MLPSATPRIEPLTPTHPHLLTTKHSTPCLTMGVGQVRAGLGWVEMGCLVVVVLLVRTDCIGRVAVCPW
jgi:hypothetical protein